MTHSHDRFETLNTMLNQIIDLKVATFDARSAERLRLEVLDALRQLLNALADVEEKREAAKPGTGSHK